MNIYARTTCLLVSLPFAGLSTPVLAQEQDHVVIGVGAAVTPNYQGSEDYRVIPIPTIDVKEGWFFANLRNGVGIEPINTENLTIGASVVFIQGYRLRDIPEGVARLSNGVGVRGFANIRAGGAITTLGLTQGVSGGTEGLVADASISYPIPLSQRVILTPTVGTTWADEKHNDGYFGITPTESLASGLGPFLTGAGFKDVTAALTATYRLTDRITLNVTGSVVSLLGDLGDSPIVEKRTLPFGIVTMAYRF